MTETKERAWPPAGAGRPGDAGSGEPAGQGGAVPAAHRTTGFLWFLPMGITLAVSLRYDPRVARGGVDLAWAADAGAPRRMTREEAAAFCGLVAAWNVVGPVVADDGALLVAHAEPVPLDPDVVRHLPPWLTAVVARHAAEDARREAP